MNIVELLKQEEGFRLKPYLDTEGIPTFGYGFTYITVEEAENILDLRTIGLVHRLKEAYSWYEDLSQLRQLVIVSMCYQISFNGFAKFKNTIKALEDADYAKAAAEMLDSRWYRQTPNRAKRHANMMELDRD